MTTLSFLEKLRATYLETENENLLCENLVIELKKKTFKLNVWRDFHGTDQLVVFELKSNSILATDSVCIGIKYQPNLPVELLTQEQLWAIGIP